GWPPPPTLPRRERWRRVEVEGRIIARMANLNLQSSILDPLSSILYPRSSILDHLCVRRPAFLSRTLRLDARSPQNSRALDNPRNRESRSQPASPLPGTRSHRPGPNYMPH